MSVDIISANVALVVNSISVITFLVFLWSFLRIPEKNVGFYMILILTVSDLCFPIVKILTILFVGPIIPVSILGPVTIGIEAFKLYWTAAFSLFTYLVYKSFLRMKPFNFMAYLFTALFCCVLSTLALNLQFLNNQYIVVGEYTISYRISEDSTRLTDFVLRNLLGRIAPILVTCFCYLKVYLFMKRSHYDAKAKRKISRRILYYSFIPILCFGPGIILDTWRAFRIFTMTEEIKDVLQMLNIILQYSWEFLNLWFYWVLIPNNNRDQESEGSSSLRSSVSSIESTLIRKKTTVMVQL